MSKREQTYAAQRAEHIKKMRLYLYGTSHRVPILEPEFLAAWLLELPQIKTVEFNMKGAADTFEAVFVDGRPPVRMKNVIRPVLLTWVLQLIVTLLSERLDAPSDVRLDEMWPRTELNVSGRRYPSPNPRRKKRRRRDANAKRVVAKQRAE